MGLRFHKLDSDSSRRLRRWVVDHTSVAGSRRQVALLHDGKTRIRPITALERIQTLMRDVLASGADVTLVPVERPARDYARLVGVSDDGLKFRAKGASSLVVGEAVHALLTVAFVSYSFGLVVERVEGGAVTCALPELVVFSERRTRSREPAPKGSSIRWRDPLEPGAWLSYPLIDVSADGFAFRTPPEVVMTLGTSLDGAELSIGRETTVLATAIVRHVRRMDGDDGGTRVGVALARPRVTSRDTALSKKRNGSMVAKLFGKVRDVVSVVVNRGKEKLGGVAASGSRRVVVRQSGLPIVGILDRTVDTNERLSAPLVVVIPGFAGRKEQLSFLAGILVEGFRRQNGDMAVLRVDSTNNLGESGKDPGCETDGLHCMHYTMTGIVDETLAILAWAKNNPFVDPTHIVVVSMSMSTIGVRHAMTLPEAADVNLWVSYMGAADPVDTVRHVGNIDFAAYHQRREKVGYISLNGVLTDGDYFWSDLVARGATTMEAAKADMAKISTDVLWICGAWDAFMDPRRVDALMQVPSTGAREVVVAQSGHLPRTSDEAIAQFVGLTRRVWSYVHASPMSDFTPSIGKLVLKNEAEWKAIRREALVDRAGWWKNYLLDDSGPGFDIVEYAPEYEEFMDLQAQLVAPTGSGPLRVLELGAGTGNLARRLVGRGVDLVATDLVPEALDTLREKISIANGVVQTAVVDLDGSPWLAYRRFVAGDLPSVTDLADRIPGIQRVVLDALLVHDGDALRAALRGHNVDVQALAMRWRLDARARRLLADCQTFARAVSGRLPVKDAQARLQVIPPSALGGQRGLPFADSSFDVVTLSLVLSYVNHPEDCIAEIRRVLKPGGRLVLSSMIRDSDTSKMYVDLIARLEQQLPVSKEAGDDQNTKREELLRAARRFVDQAAELYRIEEEGLFKFYNADELANEVVYRGFGEVQLYSSFGAPPQAVIVTCNKYPEP